MLDHKIFAKTIQQLSNYYPKFELIESEEKDGPKQMSAWFKFFQDYDNDTFLYIVKNYINENSFAPQSPAHLKNSNHAKVVLPPKWLMHQELGNDQKQLTHNVSEEQMKKCQELIDSFKEDGE